MNNNDYMISKKDFEDWYPRREVARYSGIYLWVELNFEDKSYTYVITAPNIEDSRHDELDDAIRMFNKLIRDERSLNNEQDN